MTAKQQVENFYSWLEDKVDSKGDLEDMLIRFAKFHVRAALEAAAEKCTSLPYTHESIKKAYPLENIK